MSTTLSPAARVVVVDDDPYIRKAWRVMLDKDDFEVTLCSSGHEASAYLAANEADVVLTDVLMDGMTGLQLLEHVKQTYPEIEVIIMTGQAKIADAVYATKAGAFDYITKPFVDLDACINRVRQAARVKRLSEENLKLRQQVDANDEASPDVLKSRSPVMRPVLHQVRRLARVDATVLLTGPTGAGKTAFAKALHDIGGRREAEFVYVDCGAIPSELIESELFGHMKGSFTSAVTDKKGLFEAADKGTIFLDEVGNMPLDSQRKLLRVLNDGIIRRVGGHRDIKVNVRVISATNRDLQQAVDQGAFRQDLYYRLNVVNIRLPALNERREDIPQLAYAILRRQAARHGSQVNSIDADCMERLLGHNWKGNIRQLENVLERSVIFETGEQLTLRSLPDELRDIDPLASMGASLPNLVDLDVSWKDSVDRAEGTVRAAFLRGVLDRFDGNVTQAARHAELDRSNFRRHLRRYLPDYH